MEIELLLSNGRYEIWADNDFVNDIKKMSGETSEQYKQRAEDEYNRYVSQIKNLNSGKKGNQMRYAPKTIHKTTI